MEGTTQPQQPAPGLWSWGRRHPEWHPGDFGAEVVSFLAVTAGEALLIDPLLGGEDDPAWETLDTQVGDRLRVLITVPYHVRSAEAVRDRYRSRAAISIHGHPACAQRLASTEDFAPLVSGKQLPAGVTAHPIGNPRRHETPLHLPSHDALVFGDAVAGTASGPRMWADKRVDERARRFYAERFAPSLMPLLDLDFDRLLLTHGPSVMTGGHEALRDALEAPPWYHHG